MPTVSPAKSIQLRYCKLIQIKVSSGHPVLIKGCSGLPIQIKGCSGLPIQIKGCSGQETKLRQYWFAAHPFLLTNKSLFTLCLIFWKRSQLPVLVKTREDTGQVHRKKNQKQNKPKDTIILEYANYIWKGLWPPVINVPVLKVWGVWSSPLLPLLLGPLWS